MTLSRLLEVAADTVGAAQRRLPPELRGHARNVIVLYEEKPGPDVLAEGFEPDILGLFMGSAHGQALTQDNPTPPQILLYLASLWDYADEDLDVFRDEVRLTYLHELGHYFGWDENELTARGLD
ncbi:MAG: hypothetical protein RIQ93_62 [Verrucomicrobiota bacterium]|jgi:predicted Zn-dependent protease with MMP-like domain